MPGMNGMELIEGIKRLNSSVRTILMTAFDTDEIVQENTAKGIVNGLIQKPVKVTVLRQKINEQLQYFGKRNKRLQTVPSRKRQ